MNTQEILERLDTLGKMMYEKCGTDSYEARCYLHDTKELIKQGQSLPIDSVIVSAKALQELKDWAYNNVQPHDDECHDIISRL